MTTSWKWVTGLILLAVAFCSGWLVNGWRLNASFSEEKAEVVQANADHFRGATQKVNDSAKEYSRNSVQLEKQIANLKKELSDAKKKHPLPADCRPDADRMRILKAAVTAANTAAGQ